YNAAFTARILSHVDERALREAFQNALARHSCLRSTFNASHGDILQKIHSYQEVDFQKIELSQAVPEELDSAVMLEYRRPFDLEKGPLIRVRLFSRSFKEH